MPESSNRPRRPSGRRPSARRAFTLAELILASVIGTLVLGSITASIRSVANARNMSQDRLSAYMRADAALAMMRREIATVIRSDDLFDTRVLVLDGGPDQRPLDEILVFNNDLTTSRADNRFESDGQEWETHLRVEDDDQGSALWRRRDAVPDEYPLGGGLAEPMIEGILSLSILCWDGEQWWDDWDSDLRGMPWAIRVEIVATGADRLEDEVEATRAVLRTTVAIDRVAPPRDIYEALEEELDAIEAAEAAENGAAGGLDPGGAGLGLGGDPGDDGAFGGPGGGGRPGRPGGAGGPGGGDGTGAGGGAGGGGGGGPRPPRPGGGTGTGNTGLGNQSGGSATSPGGSS